MYKESNEMTDQEVFEAMAQAESQLITDITELSSFVCDNDHLQKTYEYESNRNINQPLGLLINS